jgi:ATP-binding cassette, subfamily B, bacterial PglK
MIEMVRQLYAQLTREQLRQFFVLQILVVVMAFTEIASIASIAPFMTLVSDISLLEQDGLFSQIYVFSGLDNPLDFLFFTGFLMLFILMISTVVSMYTVWKLSLYAAKVGTEIADRLFRHYMQQNWSYHTSISSAYLTKQISVEALRVTDQVIQPLMIMNSKLVLAIFISIGIFVYDPLVALGIVTLFISCYLILYKIIRKHLDINGKKMSRIFTDRFRLMNEGFGGIKDVLLLNRSSNFLDQFEESGKDFSHARGTNTAISQVPRYFMELIAFGTMIGLVLFLLKLHEGDLRLVMPILAVYALAAFKLLPALQQVYSSMAQIKGNIAAFEAIKKDLGQSLKTSQEECKYSQEIKPLNFQLKQKIDLKNINFSYPGKSILAINRLNMTINFNTTVGIVGASGSGKSTIVDLLLGLLTPQQGGIYIDNHIINDKSKHAWQNIIGYVPQSIFLTEGSVAENIAFGLPEKDIDLNQVKKVAKQAHLSEMLELLPEGLNTKVGERGVQLSGGQRQRIGIARALYTDAAVLVFDEATSALDGITEKIIMESIHDFSGQKTIIMIAHRLKTVQKCDIIFLMDQGKVFDKGTYQQLVKNNPKFKEMALHA